MDSLLWGACLRLVQVLIFSAPWIAVGFLTAGVFRVIVTPERTKAMFGGTGKKGILFGWLWGMLLPVCSLGVIPIVLELRRCGVKGGTLIAFALTAPLFNPLSMLYGLTLSDPIAIVVFAFCSLTIVSIVGLVWDWVFRDQVADTITAPDSIQFGLKRIVGVFKAATEMIFGPASLYIVLGILGSVLVSIALPHGAMSTMLERENTFAPPLVACVSVPIYSTPLLAMSQIGSMFQHGNSVGAAFSLLIFGAGVNIGLVFCFLKLFGIKRLAVFFGLLALVGIGLAYLVSEPLYPKGVEVAGHSHAFDVYTNPFASSNIDYKAATFREIVQHWGNYEFGGTPILVLMIFLGALFLLLGRFGFFRNWLYSSKPELRFDRELPGRVIATVAVLGLIAVSIMGCYVYYPSQYETLDDMKAFNAEAVISARSGNWEAALKWIAYQEDLARRLEIGTFIRTGKLSAYHRTKARIFRENLELLKHEVEDQDKNRSKILAMQTDQAFRRLARAFTSDGE